MLNRNQIVVWALVLVSAMLGAALPAAADSVTFAKGDLAVLTQVGADGTSVFYVNAAGTARTKLASLSPSYNGWDVAFDAQGKILAATANGLYRIDPGNYNPATSGTALTVTGLNAQDFAGVAVGSAGTIYVEAYNGGYQQPKYFRLNPSGVNTYSASIVGPNPPVTTDNAWQVAVESDAPGAAKLLGFSNGNLYRFSEPSGTAPTQINTGGLFGNGTYSIAYDSANGIVYAGAYNNNNIAKIVLAGGATTTNWASVGGPSRGLEFYNDKLYATSTETASTLYTINPATGVATALGTQTFANARGIAIFTLDTQTQDVPEPVTLALIASGLAGLGGYIRRRK